MPARKGILAICNYRYNKEVYFDPTRSTAEGSTDFANEKIHARLLADFPNNSVFDFRIEKCIFDLVDAI